MRRMTNDKGARSTPRRAEQYGQRTLSATAWSRGREHLAAAEVDVA